MYWVSIFLSQRYFRGSHGKLFSTHAKFCIWGVFLSSGLLITVLSIFDGFQIKLKDSIFNFNPHITISNPLGSQQIPDWKSNINMIRTKFAEDVDSVEGMIETPGLLQFNANTDYVFIRGDHFPKTAKGYDILSKLKINILPKTLKYMPHKGSCLIGKELGINHHIYKDDYISLVVPSTRFSLNKGFLPIKKRCKVVGFFTTGHYQYDSRVIILPLDSLQSLLRIGDNVDSIAIRLKSLDKLAFMETSLSEVLPFSLQVRTIKDEQKNFFMALRLEKTVMSIILFLFVIIAMAGIVIATLGLIRSKQKDIGILRAMGMSAQDIIFLFTLHGFLLGIVGSFTGITFGIYLANNIQSIIHGIENTINNVGYLYSGLFNTPWYPLELLAQDTYYFKELPIYFDIPMFHLVFLLTICLSALAALLPALQISKLKTVDILRKE